jgi:hypothetical protein
MKYTWRYRDIIDLEYFLHQDKERISSEELPAIQQRDRQIYLDRIRQKSCDQENPDRRFLLRQWLENRREDEQSGGSNILPGQLTEEVYARLCILFPVLGILVGFGTGFSFFTYTGTAPLNVFHYLAVFVLLQLCILFILACALMVRASKSFPAPSLLSSLVTDFLLKTFQAAANRLLAQIPAEKRNSFQATLGIIKGKNYYAPLFYWPVFFVIQLFAAGFNIGLLSITLYKVTVTDIAFGWQSTIRFSSEAIFQFVQVLALPWSWCMSTALAHPSLQEIEGSRIILKDGIAHLATGNLISWWPFLCFALLTYGLLPRIILLLVALNRKKRSLGKLQFDQAVFNRLIVRMQTPLVSTQAEAEGEKEHDSTQPHIVEEHVFVDPAGVQVLVPADIYDRCPDTELIRILGGRESLLFKKLKIAEDYESDRKILDDLAASNTNNQAILILMEAWMPPITDFMVFLKDLRKALPQTASIQVGLLGKPGPETIFTPAEPGDMKVWRQKLDSLGDPYLSMENLI